jgi:RNA polymerase sigma factor (sigma-70 family)
MNSQDEDNKILLLKACNENCNESIEKFYLRFKSFINKLHKSFLVQDLEDYFQEFFVRMQEHKLKYEAKGSPEAFLKKTIINIFLEQINKNKIKPKSLHEMENDDLFPADKDAHIPLQAIDTEERNQIIMTAIAELPPKTRQAIELVYIGRLTPKEAAKLIGCDFKIFRKRLNYGKKQLYKKLEKYILS